MFEIYLPVAKMSVNAFLIIGLGVLVGFLSGLFGVGGGFLLTPLLMMIGVSPPVAAASDSNQIVASSTSGALAHKKLGNVDMKLGLVILAGGLVGSTVGVQIIKILRAMGNVDFFIKAVYVVTLGLIGSFMFKESLTALKRKETDTERKESKRPAWVARLPLQMHFPVANITTPAPFPFGLGVLVGLLAAIMGVGGGFIMVPSMIYILGMPTKVAIGTDLFQIVITSANATFQHAVTNHTVDLVLALLLLTGSTLGAQIGARTSRKLRGEQLRLILAVIVLTVMVKMLLELLLTPDALIALAQTGGGH